MTNGPSCPCLLLKGRSWRRVYRVYPRLYTDVSWHYYLDRQSVKAGDVDDLLNTLRVIRYDVRTNLNNSTNRIRLDRVLEDYKEQLLLARIPLFLILFLVIGILTYYLALIGGLVVKSRSAEIAMLKSRGATTPHIGLMALVEGLLLAIPSTALGPVVALAVVKTLGKSVLRPGGKRRSGVGPSGGVFRVILAGSGGSRSGRCGAYDLHPGGGAPGHGGVSADGGEAAPSPVHPPLLPGHLVPWADRAFLVANSKPWGVSWCGPWAAGVWRSTIACSMGPALGLLAIGIASDALFSQS